jgi:CheY-like chemotaxis protein
MNILNGEIIPSPDEKLSFMNLDKPPIVLLTEDLFLSPRIEDTLRQLGYRPYSIEKMDEDGPLEIPLEHAIALTEPLSGSDAHFVRQLTELQPALILIDISATELPWARWIQVVKTSSATRRVPIVAFGPHVAADALQRARDMGADHVVTRGKLHTSLPHIIKEWTRTPDHTALMNACQGTLSEKAERGIRLIEDGEYYPAHEYLEEAWMAAPEHEGFLYRALLQTSVAYLHVTRKNYAGAQKMMLRVRQWLDPLPEVCRGIDVTRLREHLEGLRHALDKVGLESQSDLDPALLRPIPRIVGDTTKKIT